MKHRLKRFLISLLPVAALASAAPARADECILGPVSVPALSGVPVWFDPGSGGSWRPELHDPRWSGTPLRRLDQLSSSGEGSGNEVTVRALISGRKLYFSYQVAAGSDSARSDFDSVYVALNFGSANGGAVLEVTPTAGAAGTTPTLPGGVPSPYDPSPPNHIDGASMRWWRTTADIGTGTPSWGVSNNNKPSWVSDAAVWTGSPGVDWAVTFVVDLADSTLNVTGAMKMFWGARLYDDTLAKYTAIVGNATPKSDTDPANSKVADTIVPSLSTGWVAFEAPGSCSTGITLDSDDVGVWSGTAGSTASGSLTNTICAATSASCTTTENTLRVTARGVAGTTTSPAWMIRPRFRVASWGATIGNRKYAPWTDIPGATPTGEAIFTSNSTDFTNAGGYGWYWLTPTAGSTSGTVDVTMDYRCKKQGSDTYCPVLPADHDTHQCVLVELGQKGTTQKFRNTAVYRNMDYAGLSSVSQAATVSIKGLEKATGVAKDRDVYLHVESARLPPHGKKPLWLSTKDMAVAQELAEHPIRLPKPLPERLDRPAIAARPAPGAAGVAAEEIRVKLDKATRLATSTQKLAGTVPLSSVLTMSSAQLLDSVWPRIRVRVYFDTGKTLTTKGKTAPVLEPLVPFGLYLSHEGALYGFTQSLTGVEGTVLEKLTDSWYVVRKVKNEGAFKVAPGVTAEEQPKGETDVLPGTGCPPPPVPPACPECKVEKKGSCNCTVVRGSTLFAPGLFAAGIAALALFARRARKRR